MSQQHSHTRVTFGGDPELKVVLPEGNITRRRLGAAHHDPQMRGAKAHMAPFVKPVTHKL